MPDASQPPRLILASRSPRRVLLLREGGYVFEQADPPFHDPPQPDHDHPGCPQALAGELASKKALSLREYVGPSSVILSADTICVDSDGYLIGQPRDRDDARRMIERFMHRTHVVITGVALLTDGMDQPDAFADQARVSLGPLNEAQLQAYVNSDQWRGKAGGYNLFDRRDAGWPLRVQGDETTVVGLPMRRVVPALRALGIDPQPS